MMTVKLLLRDFDRLLRRIDVFVQYPRCQFRKTL